MAQTGVVKEPFPYSEDGLNVEHLAKGVVRSFPDSQFDGLVKAGKIAASNQKAPNGNAAEREVLIDTNSLDLRLKTAFDRKLAVASDQDLKDIIARSGTPWSGNLVHAEMVAAAKLQMVRELEGEAPVLGVDPNSGVTEQPLTAPGAPTPPSAAAAIEQQQAQAKSLQDAANKGENKALDQFGKPLPAGATDNGEAKLEEMTVAELKEHAESKQIELGDATKKADIIAAITAAK